MTTATPTADSVRLCIMGAPRTKKAHNRVVSMGRRCPTCNRGNPRVLPSEQWVRWVATARVYRATAAGTWEHYPQAGAVLPDRPYNIAAIFYRDRNQGDACGFYQGLADLLAERGVLSDDKWLVSWNGSDLAKDAERPRVELVLTPRVIG